MWTNSKIILKFKSCDLIFEGLMHIKYVYESLA